MALMLTRDEQYIFNLRHGGECPSMAKLSHILGASKDNIRNIARSAKRKVNAHLRELNVGDPPRRTRRSQNKRR